MFTTLANVTRTHYVHLFATPISDSRAESRQWLPSVLAVVLRSVGAAVGVSHCSVHSAHIIYVRGVSCSRWHAEHAS